jgi:hypothetical protein
MAEITLLLLDKIQKSWYNAHSQETLRKFSGNSQVQYLGGGIFEPPLIKLSAERGDILTLKISVIAP